MDMRIIDPHGKELRYRIHTNDDESSFQAKGPRVRFILAACSGCGFW